MRRAHNWPWLLFLLIAIATIGCAKGMSTPPPGPTNTLGPQPETVVVEAECPPEFPDRDPSERYSLEYSNDVHHVFTGIVKGALGQASASCYLGLKGNRAASILLRYRFSESIAEDAPERLRAALIAAGVPESQVEMTPYASRGVSVGAVHVMDLRYLGISGQMDARFLLTRHDGGGDVVLNVETLREPCAVRPDEWTLIMPEDGSAAMQVDSTFGVSLAEALEADMKLGCVTSGGIGESRSLELRYTLDRMSISDAANAIARLLRDAGAHLDDESPNATDFRGTEVAASANFSNARFGKWNLSGEVVYSDQADSDVSIIRASLIAEPR